MSLEKLWRVARGARIAFGASAVQCSLLSGHGHTSCAKQTSQFFWVLVVLYSGQIVFRTGVREQN